MQQLLAMLITEATERHEVARDICILASGIAKIEGSASS